MTRDCYREHVARELMRYGTIIDRYAFMEDGEVTVRIVSALEGVYRIEMKNGAVVSIRDISTEWMISQHMEERREGI